MKVFLGGTVADSTWRQELIPLLTIDYFNPVVDDWNEEAYQRELYEREHCEYNLYVITPKLIGYYSIAEIMDDAMKKSDRTIYAFFNEDGDSEFSPAQIISLEELGRKVASYGSVWARSLQEIADFLNYAGEYGKDGKSNEQIKLESDYFAGFKNVNQATELWLKGNEDSNRLWSGTKLSQGLITWKKLQSKPAEHLPDLTADMHRFIDGGIALGESSRKINLFISYSRDPSTPLARGMYEHLKEKYDVWYDKVSIPHGEDFKISIEKGIRNCDNFLYIISTRAVLSPYCQAELDTAKEYGKRIIPIQQEMDVENDLIDADIRDINRIFPEETGKEQWNYEALEDQIQKVASLEQELVSTHTNFLRRGVTWKMEDFNTKVLMYDEDIQQYEKWSHELQEVRILTNPITPIHQSYYSESFAFSELGYREFWIAGEDLAVEKIVRDGFSVGADPRNGSPDGLFKASNFLFILNDDSINHSVYKEQLQHARDQGTPVFIVNMGVTEKDEVFEALPDEKWIDGSDGLDDNEIELLKSEVAVTIGNEFRYYKSPGYLSLSARHWSTRNKQNSDLMRGSMLSYFLYYQQTYPLKLSDTTKEYLEASKAITDHTPYDVFICRQKCKMNFSMWLGIQMLNQKLTSWNQHDYLTGDVTELKDEIKEGIKNSLNFVLILSQDQGDIREDDWIMFQLEEAKRLEKRIFIVKNDLGIVLGDLDQYQTVDFTTNPQQASFELINLLTTDQAFMKFFNEIFPTALQWSEREDKSARDLLLSGFPLDNAENQLEGHEQDVPETFQKFIKASRHESNLRAKRKRYTRIAIVLLAILSFIGAIGALILWQQSEEAKKEAVFAQGVAEEASIKATKEARRANNEARRADEQAKVAKGEADRANREAVRAKLAEEDALQKKVEADAAKLVAIDNEKKANTLKTIARRENRLSTSLIYAYQTRNTESSLIDEEFPRKVIQSYYFHENDGGDTKNDPDIFTALFRVATSNRYESEVNIVKNFGNNDLPYKPFAIHYAPQTKLYYTLKKHQQHTLLDIRTREDELVNQYEFENTNFEGGVVSPDGKYFWAFSKNGLQRLNLSDGIMERVGRSTEAVMKVAIASIPRKENGRQLLNEYIVAVASADQITLYSNVQDQVTQLPNPIKRNEDYVFAEAMDIEGSSGGYMLSYGKGDSVITVRGRKLGPPDMSRPWIKRLDKSETDEISALDMAGFKIAIGTRSGKVAVGDIGPISRDKTFAVTQKSKSRIKKIVLGNVYFAAITFGNQLEKTKLILNTIYSEINASDGAGMAHIERNNEDIISDIALTGSNLFYVENNNDVKFHTLQATEMVEQICKLLADCDKEYEIFKTWYQEETMVQNELKFCTCNEGETE